MSLRVVTVTAAGGAASTDGAGAGVAGALEAAGLAVSDRSVIEPDEAVTERALSGDGGVTVVMVDPAGDAADLVRRVLARATGTRLVLSDRMLGALEERHRMLDRPVPRAAERQALLPQGAVVWESTGEEPAWGLESAAGAFAVLAPSGDVSAVLERHVIPLARARLGAGGTVATRVLRTAGVSLGDVEARVAKPAAAAGDDVSVSLVARPGEVWVRLRARGETPERAARALSEVDNAVAAALGDDCFGRDDETLEQVVGRLLGERGLTLATAESCTGGLVGHRLTDVAGSSAYFERGVVVYSNQAKQELLGVPESILIAHGAVSGPCAEAMARGICERARTACGLAITGIAGPGGGTPTKPVGTVFIGVAVSGDVRAQHFLFAGDRRAIKWQSAQTALDLLRRRLARA